LRKRGKKSQASLEVEAIKKVVQRVFKKQKSVCLVTLFGSQARGTATADSDIDLLVWVYPEKGLGRKAVWGHWDLQTVGVPWARRASLLVKSFDSVIELHTLLLDLPEEHIPLYDCGNFFVRLKKAVVKWRRANGAKKLPSFNNTHSWRYTSRGKDLRDIDFTLRIDDVA
jgi:hypothetical protein